MEAMSIESLVLSTWEEEGFVGKTRVPIGRSDVDVLAIHAGEKKVRIGEAKVREGSQKVYVVDDYSLAFIEKQPEKDFTGWMIDGWSDWLRNLPKLWNENGQPVVPWLLDLTNVSQIEVVFCCNLVVLCDPKHPDKLLAHAASRYLRQNSAFEGWFANGGLIRAEVKPTIAVATDLVSAVFKRIDAGYGRRFANPFKDLFRELHRYLSPELDRLPWDHNRQPKGSHKLPFQRQLRKEVLLGLLKAMEIKHDELREWVSEISTDNKP